MLDRVLDQRLKDQSRNLGIHRSWIDLIVNRQPILKPCLLDFEILLQKLQFLLKRHARGIRSRERDAEQVGEATDHSIGGVWLRVNQRGNCVQRVEQKVRVELRLERLQSRFGQSRLE